MRKRCEDYCKMIKKYEGYLRWVDIFIEQKNKASGIETESSTDKYQDEIEKLKENKEEFYIYNYTEDEE